MTEHVLNPHAPQVDDGKARELAAAALADAVHDVVTITVEACRLNPALAATVWREVVLAHRAAACRLDYLAYYDRILAGYSIAGALDEIEKLALQHLEAGATVAERKIL